MQFKIKSTLLACYLFGSLSLQAATSNNTQSVLVGSIVVWKLCKPKVIRAKDFREKVWTENFSETIEQMDKTDEQIDVINSLKENDIEYCLPVFNLNEHAESLVRIQEKVNQEAIDSLNKQFGMQKNFKNSPIFQAFIEAENKVLQTKIDSLTKILIEKTQTAFKALLVQEDMGNLIDLFKQFVIDIQKEEIKKEEETKEEGS